MSKTIFTGESPKSQAIDAVKSLLAFVGRSSDPLPSDVSMDGGRVVLVLSNKRDAYYVTTAKACSCPSSTYRPGQSCKHQRKYFGAKSEAKLLQDLGWIGPDGQRANGPVEA